MTSEGITKEMFDRYEDVRLSGEYNMVTEADMAMSVARLSPEEYWKIIECYGNLKDKYGGK